MILYDFHLMKDVLLKMY